MLLLLLSSSNTELKDGAFRRLMLLGSPLLCDLLLLVWERGSGMVLSKSHNNKLEKLLIEEESVMLPSGTSTIP